MQTFRYVPVMGSQNLYNIFRVNNGESVGYFDADDRSISFKAVLLSLDEQKEIISSCASINPFLPTRQKLINELACMVSGLEKREKGQLTWAGESNVTDLLLQLQSNVDHKPRLFKVAITEIPYDGCQIGGLAKLISDEQQ